MNNRWPVNNFIYNKTGNPIVDWFNAAVSELSKEALECIAGRLIPGDHRHIGRVELVQMIEGSLNLAIMSFKELLKGSSGDIGSRKEDFSPYRIDRKRPFDNPEEVSIIVFDNQYPKKKTNVLSSRMDPKSQSSSGMEPSSPRNIVLVSNLDERVSDITWKLLFKEYGSIERYWRHPNGKECFVKVIEICF